MKRLRSQPRGRPRTKNQRQVESNRDEPNTVHRPILVDRPILWSEFAFALPLHWVWDSRRPGRLGPLAPLSDGLSAIRTAIVPPLDVPRCLAAPQGRRRPCIHHARRLTVLHPPPQFRTTEMNARLLCAGLAITLATGEYVVSPVCRLLLCLLWLTDAMCD